MTNDLPATDPANEPGWLGVLTRHQAKGAIANGKRVRKVQSESRDTHPDGAQATVLGSLYVATHGYGYFVEWDDRPRHAVFIAGARIAPADSSQ